MEPSESEDDDASNRTVKGASPDVGVALKRLEGEEFGLVHPATSASRSKRSEQQRRQAFRDALIPQLERLLGRSIIVLHDRTNLLCVLVDVIESLQRHSCFLLLSIEKPQVLPARIVEMQAADRLPAVIVE